VGDNTVLQFISLYIAQYAHEYTYLYTYKDVHKNITYLLYNNAERNENTKHNVWRKIEFWKQTKNTDNIL